jgi:hypothetical protein
VLVTITVWHAGRRYVLGRHLEPNHDPASRSYPAATAPLATSYHRRHGPILDQGDLGACTGFATAGSLNTDPLLLAGRRLLTADDAKAIYSWATSHDPFRGHWPPDDTGSDGLSVAKAARRLGLISSYRHAFGLQHVLAALVVRPLIIGVPWRRGMFSPGPDGVLDCSGPVDGGHEIELCGIDVERELVIAVNSWGDGWGIPAPECGITTGGTCRIRWTDLGGLLAAKGDATVLVP